MDSRNGLKRDFFKHGLAFRSNVNGRNWRFSKTMKLVISRVTKTAAGQCEKTYLPLTKLSSLHKSVSGANMGMMSRHTSFHTIIKDHKKAHTLQNLVAWQQ